MFSRKKYHCIICGFESGKAICKNCNMKVTNVLMWEEKDDSPLVNYLAKLIDGDRQR